MHRSTAFWLLLPQFKEQDSSSRGSAFPVTRLCRRSPLNRAFTLPGSGESPSTRRDTLTEAVRAAEKPAAPRPVDLVVFFELENLVFYSEFLTLEIADHFWVRQRPADFSVEFRFKVCMPRAKRIKTILKRHWRLQSSGTETLHDNAERLI
jgi:hypothetical protein